MDKDERIEITKSGDDKPFDIRIVVCMGEDGIPTAVMSDSDFRIMVLFKDLPNLEVDFGIQTDYKPATVQTLFEGKD